MKQKSIFYVMKAGEIMPHNAEEQDSQVTI